ncbi:MAG: hypothetical protein GTO55_02530 [Armatimonadetes bacterium]|nr:hypothetical protein [Armatimonadota bacterium]NIM23156.1 hypothetical protein [Armatimonadota bacterium]NIM67024.1 hypothetical protein [Armatimonadota bacterium]NIM75558.1 hypothetical protein [Armatimonadota bacterium]NIN05213.1 hypothetical protein [Armatimonadota bacterium]
MISTTSLIWVAGIMGAIALAMTVFAVNREGSIAVEGWLLGGKMLLQILPLLLFAFAIAGLVQVLVPKEVIAIWLGDKSGWRGIVFGCLVGSVTPGGPFVTFPVVASIYRAGADVGTIVAFITAWSLWGFQRMPMEVALVGPRLAFARFMSTFLFAPVAGLVARALFSGFVRKG